MRVDRGEEFTCAACGEEFLADRSHDEAVLESEENFPGMPAEDRAVVCECCYQRMVAACPPRRFMQDLTGGAR